MARDPVCGMMVDEKTAYRTEHGGITYYFCGAGCKSEFKKTIRMREEERRVQRPKPPKVRSKSCH